MIAFEMSSNYFTSADSHFLPRGLEQETGGLLASYNWVFFPEFGPPEISHELV